MSKKQDRPGARTATDLERKYNFGDSVTAGYVQSTVKNAVAVATNEFKGYVDTVNKDVTDQGEKIAALEQADKDIQTEMNELKQTDTETGEAIAEIRNSIAENKTHIESVEEAVEANTTAIDGVEKSIDSIEQAMAESSGATDVSIAGLRRDLETTTSTANRAAAEVEGVINDVYDRFAFVEGGTTIKGSIFPMVLPPGTDLDGVLHFNKYTGGNVAEYGYLHCPISTGTFSLEVESCGNEGQILQRLTYSHKTNGKTYERVFYTDGWGNWALVTDYTNASIKAVQNDVDALETAFNQHKTKSESDIKSLSTSTQNLSSNVQALSADLQGVINDVNTHFDFNEGGLTIKGAINPALIPAGEDLDGLMIPNKYIGGTVTEYNYLNCPVPSGTFVLDVESCGDQGQLKQTLHYCNKTLGRTYERYFYGTSWGEWFCITDFTHVEASKLLWNDGVYYMTATQTVNLPEAISAQKNGIILVFSEYSGGALDSAFHCFYIPKTQVALHPGAEYTFVLATNKLAHFATKTVGIYDTKITGHADNNQTGTSDSGVKFTNNRFVLRYVFGF